MRGHRLPASATAGRGGAIVAATRGAQGITEGSAFLREYGA